MPRGPRLDAPHGLYHVMARGIEGRPLFCHADDHADFLARLSRLTQASRSPLYAWALLSNHFHLLLRRGAVPLSALMRRLLTGYAVAFNRRHCRTGHLLQNRFKSILVEEERYLLELVRYIHLNPLRAGMVTTPAELERYPWTGHRVLLGRVQLPAQDGAFILEQFAPNMSRARQAYREFIQEGCANGQRPDLAGGGLHRSLGNWRACERLSRGRERWAADERILGSGQFVHAVLSDAPPLQPSPLGAAPDPQAVVGALLDRVARECGVSAGAMATNSRRRAVVAARAIVSYIAVRHHALPPTHVAAVLGVSRQTVLYGVTNAAVLLARQHWSPDLLRT